MSSRSWESVLLEIISSIPEALRWKVERDIDFEHTDIRGRVVPKHLGTIASAMTDWESSVADELGLTPVDTHDILEKNYRKPVLQRREALTKWRSRLGSQATYKALMIVFLKANHRDYAENVAKVLKDREDGDCREETDVRRRSDASVSSVGSLVSGQGAAALPTQAKITSGGHASSAVSLFSYSMTPEQLALWLFQQYGDAYQEDIGKMKGALINGELFLDLPEDEELLKEIKLSPAFKRLLLKKASQVKASLAVTASVPVTPGNRASLPTARVPFCTSGGLDEDDVDCSLDCTDTPDDDCLAAWVPRSVIWRRRKELAVKFLHLIPSHWTCGGKQMNIGNIMSWANEWSLRGNGVIPKFILVVDSSAPSDIRVEFMSNGDTKSKIGKKATTVEDHKPTMWLDLHSGRGMDDDYKKHLVIHEFGHALGLGHEHQRSDFWENIKAYVDVVKMKADLNVSDAKFDTDWGRDNQFKRGRRSTPYDSDSVMHYWFLKDWLTNGYSVKTTVEKDTSLPSEVKEALLGVHKRHNHVANEPSEMDIQLLMELYAIDTSASKCTIQGPPPPTQVECVLNNKERQKAGEKSQRITMFQLRNLKLKNGEEISIINKLAPCWKRFASLLDFDDQGTTVDIIDKKCRGDPEECCQEAMRRWLSGEGRRQPADWPLLVKILREMKLGELAKQVEQATYIKWGEYNDANEFYLSGTYSEVSR